MKGIVFTEFLEMVEGCFSADLVDDIIDDARLPSDGAYTAVGTYDHGEMVALLIALSQRTGVPASDWLLRFGQYLFGRFVDFYPAFFEGVTDPFIFMSGVDAVIHAEVLKLYPDAELPHFSVEHHDSSKLILVYDSRRHLEDLAEGLIRGCISHFGEDISLSREVLGEGETRKERFTLRRSCA